MILNSEKATEEVLETVIGGTAEIPTSIPENWESLPGVRYKEGQWFPNGCGYCLIIKSLAEYHPEDPNKNIYNIEFWEGFSTPTFFHSTGTKSQYGLMLYEH